MIQVLDNDPVLLVMLLNLCALDSIVAYLVWLVVLDQLTTDVLSDGLRLNFLKRFARREVVTGLGLVLSWLDVAPHDDSRDGAAALFDARLER